LVEFLTRTLKRLAYIVQSLVDAYGYLFPGIPG
jgi:hypothetical protein